VQATTASRALGERITTMERAARQHLVFEDAALLDAYRQGHTAFLETVRQFDAIPLSKAQRERLTEIVAKEGTLYDLLTGPRRTPIVGESMAADFSTLSELAKAMIVDSNALIGREVDALQMLAGQAQQWVGWQLLALLPVAMFLVIALTIQITRPVRQLERSIRALGDGKFDREITVNGPEDLEKLGKRLNWLRLRLMELEEQKARFLRNVSHELKTPLTALREGSELLAEEATGKLTPGQKEIVRILRDNSLRLRRLIEDLLNYSALHYREARLEVKPVRMRATVGRVVADQKLAILAKGITLASKCEDVTLLADEEKLRIIIDNLLSNAVKFTPESGTIRLTLEEADGSAILDVIDSGPGIAPQERQRIFDAFYQGGATSSGRVRGSGLGLSIVKELVAVHHGSVEVIDGHATGASFRVTLPLAQPSA
jgi:two-component system sensor histidine kinase GlrK